MPGETTPIRLPAFRIARLGPEEAPACAALQAWAFIVAYDKWNRAPERKITDFVLNSGFVPRKLQYHRANAAIGTGRRVVRHRSPSGQWPVVGFCVGFQSPENPTKVNIDAVYVRPDRMGRGVGLAAIKAMLFDYPEYQTLRTQTTRGTAAVGFFAHLGFRETDEYVPHPPEPYEWNGTILPQVAMEVSREEFEVQNGRLSRGYGFVDLSQHGFDAADAGAA